MRAVDTTPGSAVATGEVSPPRRPYWLVGLALMGLVLVLLVGAFLLDKQFRPRVGMEDGSEQATVEKAVPGTAANSEPAQSAAAQDSISEAPARPGVVVPSEARVGSTPLEREIEEAYLKYWEIRSEAYLSLDASRLSEVAGGPKLMREERQIRELQEQGRAGRIAVEHQIALVKVSSDHAVVYDEYLNRSVFVDLNTKQDIPTSSSPEREKVSFEMKKINGVWKVIDGAQHG